MNYTSSFPRTIRIKIWFFILCFTIFSSTYSYSQVENVPQTNLVYTFLKEMKVKKIIDYYNEDVPNLSRIDVKKLLSEIKVNKSQLSNTELSFLSKYLVEFSATLGEDTTQVFFNGDNIFGNLTGIFSDKMKYLFAYKEENANVYFDLLGHLHYSQMFKPVKNNAELYDIGFRGRGTVFNHLGYNLTVIKGGVSGNEYVAEIIEPRLLTNFKWIENAENIGNYDFAEGYLKFRTEPVEKMDLSIQVGREPLKIGYGYGNSLLLSGNNPSLDFLQFNFNYGVVHFASIHASTVGEFSFNREERFTKYWAFNRLRLAFPNLFDIGIGESVVYSNRGIDLAYLTPVGFYKFIEMSTQDRDNVNLYFDFRSDFLSNLEVQATFLLDENILSNLTELDRYTNKTAYQLGAFWYEAFTLKDFSLILEYTRIRPYVYTHFDIKNSYSAFGVNLGHNIGPNADEILLRIGYNVNERIRVIFDYRHIRNGENVYDENGNLIRNVGGDVFLSHGENIENKTASFLDGIRINYDLLKAVVRVEPIRDYIFELAYNYGIENHVTENFKNYSSFASLKFILEY